MDPLQNHSRLCYYQSVHFRQTAHALNDNFQKSQLSAVPVHLELRERPAKVDRHMWPRRLMQRPKAVNRGCSYTGRAGLGRVNPDQQGISIRERIDTSG
ncbi:hypothetical protein GCM10027402_34340 [Arthrobacter monumenti]